MALILETTSGRGPGMKFTVPSKENLIQRVAQQLTRYSKPRELASFSYDDHRQLHFDRSQLRRYQPADDFFHHADLRRGFESFIQKPKDLEEHLDALLATAKHYDISEAFDFVTWRGILTKMLCTPFLRGESWKLNGNFAHNTIFLEEVKKVESFNHKHQEFIYGGFKFESLCMVPTDASKTPYPMAERAACVVNNLSEFGVVFKSTLGNHRLLFGAEIDGLDAEGRDYLELKTTATLTDHNLAGFQEEKLLKWWAQSFLAGVPQILVGYRSQRGWIESLEMIKVDLIPRRTRGLVRWDPQLILAFGDSLLSWLQETVKSHPALTRPQDSIGCFTLTYDALQGEIEFSPTGSVFIK